MGSKSLMWCLGISALLLFQAPVKTSAAATSVTDQAAAQTSAAASFKTLGLPSTSDVLAYAKKNAGSGFCVSYPILLSDMIIKPFTYI